HYFQVKFILPLVLSFCISAAHAQPDAGIEYSANGSFDWSMFKGKINNRDIAEMGKNVGAVTVSALSYETLGQVGHQISLKISALFMPYTSWTRYPKLYHPAEALNHEKRHFDICEIYARLFRKHLMESHFRQSNFRNDLAALFKKYITEYRAMQTRYDRETRHSLDAYQQEKWNAKIDATLKALDGYADNVITVSLN
ncbi:MAG TPA: hypothetical protein VJ508_19695, partial [Saprospiraceae bacterium]|nr:hypothetical protein [Saprospiraceae bacterium]